MNRFIRLLSLLSAVSFLLSTASLAEEPLDSYEELCQKGRQQLAKGRFDKAIVHYSNAIGEEPSKPLAFVSRAIVYCAMNQYENAEVDSQRAVALDEKNVDAHLVLGSTLRLMKRYDDAEKTFRNVIYELDERSADAYAGRGKLYLDMQDDERAERDFSKALSLNPKLEHVYIERAAICRRNEEFGQAIRDYSSVIDDLKRNVPQYYFLRAQVRLADKRYGEALKDARYATKKVPDYVAAYGIQVAALFQQEDYDGADEALKQAEYHAESEPGVLLWRGRLLAAEAKYEEA